MNPETFLQLAEEGGFLDPGTVAKIRRQIEKSPASISIETVTSALVRKGLLTPDQIETLMNAVRKADGPDDIDEDFLLQPADDSASLLQFADADDEGVTYLEAETVPETPAAEVAPPPPPDAAPQIDLGDPLGAEEGALDIDAEYGGPSVSLQRSAWQRWMEKLLGSRHRRQGWDSRFMIFGGASLLFLVAAAAVLYFVLSVGSGDEFYQAAEEDYKSQLYGQAIEKFQKFTTRYRRHNKVSMAKVRVGLARMRLDLSSGNWQRALTTAEEQLVQIRDEPSFENARPELASILPDIFSGFVEEAAEVESADEKELLLQNAAAASQLVENPDYLPSSQRQQVQGRLDAIQLDIGKIQRDIQRIRAIQEAITQIDAANAADNSTDGYRIYDQLVAAFPGAAKDDGLQSAVREISATEKRAVQVGELRVPAKTVDHPKSDTSRVFLTARVNGQSPAVSGHVLYALARGAVYALDGGNGKVLWRRWIGLQSRYLPQTIEPRPGADALVQDEWNQELVRLDAATGKLVWRTKVGKAAGATTIAGQTLFQAIEEGRLLALNLSDGETTRQVEFPQGLAAPPAVDIATGEVYQPGLHSTLYVLDAQDLSCQHTLYVGHREGTISVAPVLTNSHVLLVENGTTDYCYLHVFARNEESGAIRVGDPLRLDGAVFDAPVVTGASVVVTTDRGAVYVLETDRANREAPIRVVAQIQPREDRWIPHYVLRRGNDVFVGGNGLTQYRNQQARGALKRIWSDQIGEAHLARPQLFGNTIVTRRMVPRSNAVLVEAAELAKDVGDVPQPIWRTILSARPAGEVVVDTETQKIIVCSAAGNKWNVDAASLRKGHVAAELPDFDQETWSGLLPLADGKFALPSSNRSRWQLMEAGALGARLSIVGNRATSSADPFVWQQGMVVLTDDGKVHWVDPDDGQPLSAAFQLPVAERDAGWANGVGTDQGELFVATIAGVVHRLSPSDETPRRLVSTANYRAPFSIQRLTWVDDETITATSMPGDKHEIVLLSTNDLSLQNRIEFSSPLQGHPLRIGNELLCQKSDGRLVLYDPIGSQRWESGEAYSPLAGRPISNGNGMICATIDGSVHQIERDTGEALMWDGQPQLTLPEPLGAAPTIFAGRVLLLGHDCTLHVLALPK